jgi:hypothetical protein
VWVKQVEFDGTWAVGAGSLGGGFDQRPPGGKVSIIYPKQAPRSVYAQWFSYRTQTFYEVTFLLPEDLDDKLRKWYRDYPLEDYSHTLIVGFSGKGEALAWWKAFCSTCSYDRSHDFSTPLVENVKGEVVEGDPGRYNVRTGEHVERGTIPPPPMWLIRQSDGDAGN